MKTVTAVPRNHSIYFQQLKALLQWEMCSDFRHFRGADVAIFRKGPKVQKKCVEENGAQIPKLAAKILYASCFVIYKLTPHLLCVFYVLCRRLMQQMVSNPYILTQGHRAQYKKISQSITKFLIPTYILQNKF